MIRIPLEQFKPEVGYAKYYPNSVLDEKFVIYGRDPPPENIKFYSSFVTITGGSHPGRYYPQPALHSSTVGYSGKIFNSPGIIYAPFIPTMITGVGLYFKLTDDEAMMHVCLERI